MQLGIEIYIILEHICGCPHLTQSKIGKIIGKSIINKLTNFKIMNNIYSPN